MLKISYKDGQNWIDINGNIRNWTNLYDLYKNGRVQPNYIMPEIITAKWNGKIHDVQHIRWDAWYIELYIKESELHEINKLKNCDTILITDTENGISSIIDTQTSQWIDFSEPERIADTTNWKIDIIYRTNKTVINKIEALINEVPITVNGNIYYSKFEINPLIDTAKIDKIKWGNILELILGRLNKIGYSILLYMTNSEMELFKNDYNIGYDIRIGAELVQERLPLEISEIGEDYYRIIMNVITIIDFANNMSFLTNKDEIVINSNHYYTKQTAIEIISDRNFIDTEWENNLGERLFEFLFSGYKIMMYLTDAELKTFKSDYDKNDGIVLNSINIIKRDELKIEAGIGLYNIVTANLWSIRAQIDSYNILTQKVTLIGTNTYQSNWNKLVFDNSIKINVKWDDGSDRLLRETLKKGYKVLFIFNRSVYELFVEEWNKVNFTIDGTDIIEKTSIESERLENDYYKVIIKCFISTSVRTVDFTASHSVHLQIIDTNTYNFYTDFPTIDLIQDSNIDSYDNEQGIKTKTKVITRRLKIVQFWSNNYYMKNIKEHFEAGTSTLDSIPVLENRIVEIQKLDYELYYIKVKCLMEVNIQYF